MQRSKLTWFLIVGFLLLAFMSINPVLAEDPEDSDNSDADEWFEDLWDAVEDSFDDDGGFVIIEDDEEDSGQPPFDDYNSPPDTSGSQDTTPVFHVICPPSVGRLTLATEDDIRSTNGLYSCECDYVEVRYIAEHYQTYELASFSIAWAEDSSISEGLLSQLCMSDYIGWDEWWESEYAISVPDVYIHDDEIALKDELKRAIKEALARVEDRAITCTEARDGDGSGAQTPPVTEDTPEEETPTHQDEFTPSGPFNDDCSVNEEEFERDWIKYSDLDENIPLEERSWEAQQFYDIMDWASELMLEAYLLDRDMEIDRLMRVELRDYRNALVRNLRQNLIKSFIRLTWLTYDTIKPAVGLGKSYGKVIADAEASGLQQVTVVTNFVRANIPGDSAIAFNTKTLSGKFMSVEANRLMNAMGGFAEGNFSSMGLGETASKVGSGLVGDLIKQSGIVPAGPKLTDADFALLKDQHDRTRALDTALHDSYRKNSERRADVELIEAEVASLLIEAQNWQDKEKERVQLILEDDCQRQRERFEEGL